MRIAQLEQREHVHEEAALRRRYGSSAEAALRRR